jgi:hypothetical protein
MKIRLITILPRVLPQRLDIIIQARVKKHY